MKIITETILEDFNARQGAADTKQRIIEHDKVEEFDELIAKEYPNGITDKDLNDLLWFDKEHIYDALLISSEDGKTRLSQAQVDVMLEKHERWVNGAAGGEEASFNSMDISNISLRSSDLSGVDFRNCVGRYTDFSDCHLYTSNFEGSKLDHANFAYADLELVGFKNVDLRYVNLSNAKLHYVDFTNANIDYASWPLWCGSLSADIDDKIAAQLLYHVLATIDHSDKVSDELKEKVLTAQNKEIANRFHHVEATSCMRL